MKADISAAKAVRVSIPVAIASDIGGLKKSMGTILDKLGCRACCSGFDIFLERQREALVSDSVRGKVKLGGFAASRAAASTLRVGVSASAVSSIEDVNSMLEKIADLSGHVACATGCDIFFQMEEMFVLDRNLAVEQVALRVGR
jgi:hypothetical protein